MGLFKLRKNKRYSYSGRFSEQHLSNDKSTVPRKIKPKFEKFRNAINDFKKGSEKYVRVRLLIILIILVFILLLFFVI